MIIHSCPCKPVRCKPSYDRIKLDLIIIFGKQTDGTGQVADPSVAAKTR